VPLKLRPERAVGRRSRQRAREAGESASPILDDVDYSDLDGNVLTLRASMSAATRREYATLADRMSAAATRDDVWQRSLEFLFERLAVRWVIAGLPLDGQRELLGRLRAASAAERDWVRETLRAHCAKYFPELVAP
jgi:hypothetical protein